MTTPNAKALIKRWMLPGAAVILLAVSSSSSAACLIKPRQTAGASTVYTLMLAPQQELSTYTSLGFVPVPCPTDLSLVRVYVERLCAVAGASSLPALDAQALIGLTRDRVCTSARAGLTEAGG